MHRAFKYAADMRALEKQNRIVILPCAIGDTIYLIERWCDDSVPIEECEKYENCDLCCFFKWIVIERKMNEYIMYCAIKNKLFEKGLMFLDKKEAEERAAAMNLEENIKL